MAGRDRKLDATTGDYVKDGNGGYETTITISTAVYHQLKLARGSWWGDPDRGCDLHLVTQMGITQGTVVFAKNAVKTALQRFVDEGLAKDLEVNAVGDANGRLGLQSLITDIQAGQLDVSGLTRVG